MDSSTAKRAQPAACTAFILAGGQSSRMGRDKALVELAGKPLIEHAVNLVRECGLEPQIAGARADLAAYAPVLHDDTPDNGPLGGICTALRHTEAEIALFLPVDLPLVPATLLRYLIFHAQITGRSVSLSSVNGFAQTFPAVIRRDSLPILETELRAGRSGCFSAFKTAGAAIIAVEMVVQSGHVVDPRALSSYRWFSNLNTPQELERLDTLIA